MCGIVGVAVCRGRSPSVTDVDLLRMRDLMAHRGPDGAGLWRRDNLILGHRRLAVIDPTPAGAQPMVSASGRYVIAYNGELYNDAELRRDLEAEGVHFLTRCDTETVLHAVARWGLNAFNRLRGMYALAFYDTLTATLTLARDPLGIKPLFVWFGTVAGGPEVVFASELPALLAHPAVPARPNLAVVSSYLTTIRTTLGAATLFDGVMTLRAGECVQVDLSASEPRVDSFDWWESAQAPPADPLQVGPVVRDSIHRHLRADVPTCALLSGGLDSTIVCTVARGHLSTLHTYCAGVAEDDSGPSPDFAFARQVAAGLGTMHEEVPLTREAFRELWPTLVHRLGRPLSTPNETAIFAVASRIRSRGDVVAISGEGADELFGGYDHCLQAAAEWRRRDPRGDPGAFEYESASWAGRDAKRLLFHTPVWTALEHDQPALDWYRREFSALSERAPDALGAHLMMQRRINLVGLLERLDGATMLASVEGRTPLADSVVALLAEALPMREKFLPLDRQSASSPPSAAEVARTKIALRLAFARDIPREILARPKASFPLPFQQWVEDHAPALRSSPVIRDLFRASAIDTVASQPREFWHLAWPMINLAMWSKRWWG